MGKIINALNSYDVRDNTKKLYRIFESINDFDIPIVRFIIYPGSGLLRQRINQPEKEFYKISDLSYPPASCLLKYGRANLPSQPIFYACSFSHEISDDVPFPRVISLMETSSFFRDKQSSGVERATISRWDVIDELNLIALPFADRYQRPCPDVRYLVKSWEKIIKDIAINPEGLELVQYMSTEIANNFSTDEEYVKIANFVNYLLNINKKTKDADGIIYPSVYAQGAGFNVAIKPHIVDKKIKFVSASLCHLLKQCDQAYLAIMNYSQINSEGDLVYIEKKFDECEADIYKKYMTNLSFIN